jgi:hypothetical protein
MLFGTFKNAERFEPETGFYDGASRRIGAMLMFRDVSRPPAAGAASPLRESPSGRCARRWRAK